MKSIYSTPSCKVLSLQTTGILAVSTPAPSKYDQTKEDNADQFSSKRIWDNEKWS